PILLRNRMHGTSMLKIFRHINFFTDRSGSLVELLEIDGVVSNETLQRLQRNRNEIRLEVQKYMFNLWEHRLATDVVPSAPNAHFSVVGVNGMIPRTFSFNSPMQQSGIVVPESLEWRVGLKE
ncbi:MAG: hypothetical protein M1835_004330, partial [Candelina submexicana]